MKVLVALETCALPKYAERRKLITSTWGKRLKEPFTFMEFDGPMLGVGDGYQDLPAKTRTIASYARDHGYDWLLIVDDDVFIKVERLTIPTHGDYLGKLLPEQADEANPLYCAGAFYWLSKRAISLVADAPLTNRLAEDQWVGDVLRANSIHPVCDPQFTLYPCPCDHCKDATIPDFTAISFSHRWLPEEYAKLEHIHGS